MAGEWRRATFIIDNILHTQTNIITAFESFLTQVGWVRASWSGSGTDRYYLRADRLTQPRWQFTGDGGIKQGGIRIFYDSAPATTTGLAAFTGQVHIVIQTFLENAATNGSQVLTEDVINNSIANPGATTFRLGSIRLIYDNTAPNTYLLIGGEDGLYVEVGRDSQNNNLGHGAILTFGAIPENHSSIDNTVGWTAQGLVADLFGVCRFTTNRQNRFVSNDGSSKNFTAGLQAQSPRGTYSLSSPLYSDAVALSSTGVANAQGRRGLYISSRDVLYGMGRAGTNPESSTTVASSAGNIDLQYLCAFGLFNSPQAGRYRISPMLCLQTLGMIDLAATSSSTSDVVVQTNIAGVVDPRSFRQIFRFAVVDYTLLPWVNIQDAVSGATYRVAQVADNGRYSQIGIEWPSSAALSISL